MGQYGSYEKYVVDKGAAVANPAAIALEAALNTVVLLSRPLMEPISVSRFGYQAVVALAYGGLTAEGKLTLYRYPGGDANTKVALQTIRLVDATAIGSVCYADVPNPVVPATLVGGVITVRARNKADMEVGDVVAIWITTAATGGGGIAGDFQPFFTFHPRAEVKLNQPLMVNLTP